MKILLTCKEGFEKTLAREVPSFGLNPGIEGRGWIMAEGELSAALQKDGGLCFACDILPVEHDIQTQSVNALAEQLLQLFIAHIGDKKVIDPWHCHFFSSGNEKLIHHTATLKKRWFDKFRKKMSRVAQLAVEGIPGTSGGEGFFVYVTDFNQAYVSFRMISQGQKRMALDPDAPSRSYLKLEEAFCILGRSPKDGEIVIDLGAAPGGWTLSALKRGACVIAVDNGPMREPVRSNPRMTHLMVDALSYQHKGPNAADWLLCDVLETPEIIVELLRKWLDKKWCRYFVVNLKLGRRDPIKVLEDLRDPQKGLLPYCQGFLVRQLYHDRDEITIMGSTLN